MLVVMVLREIRVLPIAQQLYVWLVTFEKPVVNSNPTGTTLVPVERTDLLGCWTASGPTIYLLYSSRHISNTRRHVASHHMRPSYQFESESEFRLC